MRLLIRPPASMLREGHYTLQVPAYTPEQTAVTAKEMAALLAVSAVELDVIEAALLSVMTAIERVKPEARTELQSLVAEFTASPQDDDIVKRLGALLRNARSLDH